MYRILVSGYWDCLDPARVQYLQKLSRIGQVIVVVHNDERAKQRTEVSLLERVELMKSCKYVSEVHAAFDEHTVVHQAGITHFGGHEYGEVKAQDLGLPSITFGQPAVVPRRPQKASWLL